MNGDTYAVSAPVYDLLITSFRPVQVAALERLIPLVRAESGPVLDIGAGSGLNTVFVLERLPEAHVYALEPSTAMRALVLTKVAAHPEWFDRVTIRPEAFGAAPLPDAIGAAILLGVLGHFTPDERAALFAALAARLPEGGATLMDLQPPAPPTPVEPHEGAARRRAHALENDLPHLRRRSRADRGVRRVRVPPPGSRDHPGRAPCHRTQPRPDRRHHLLPHREELTRPSRGSRASPGRVGYGSWAGRR